MLIRPSLALVAAITGLARSWTARRIVPALVIGALTAAGLGAYLLYSHHYWSGSGGPAQDGAFNVTATHNYGQTLANWSPAEIGHYAIRIAGALASPGRGVLVGAPFLLLLVPGLRAAWRTAPGWVRAAAVGGIAYLLVQLKAEIFSGGIHFWSYRYPLEALTLCAPLLVLAWQSWTAHTPMRRAGFAALVSVAVGMQAVGAVCFRGPYSDNPWTFDDFRTALTGSLGPAAAGLLALGVLSAGWFLRRGYTERRCLTSPALTATAPESVATTNLPMASTAVAVPTTVPPLSSATDTDWPSVRQAAR